MRLVYIAHALRGDWAAGVAAAKKYALQAALRGCMPVVPYVLMDGVLDDQADADRQLGMRLDLEQLEQCHEIWLCGTTVSEGMQLELVRAEAIGLTVRRFATMSDLVGWPA
jgi:hypothetical protein